MLSNNEKFSLPNLEEKVLKFWKENQIFDKSLRLKNRKQKTLAGQAGDFIFYEGPPTANGRPGIHHVLSRAFKDIIPRYKTMRGFSVPRKGGWDTHGLPVELEVEKALGLKSKKEIEEYGIAAFNKACRESVWKYKDEWERLTERIGFWLDLKNPYITYETSYIETLWWIIGEIWKKKMLYKGHKVVPWCTRCGTALSSHEIAQGYKEVEDRAVYVKFKLDVQSAKSLTSGDRPVYILSWTTTPWTLPGNVALAVKEDTRYSMVLVNGEVVIVADELVMKIFGNSDQVNLYGKTLKGKDLIGLKYKPLFDIPALRSEKSHKIYGASFVTTTDGTGVVHTAVMYGEDDYNLGRKIGLPQHHTVSENGRFTNEVKGLSGLYVKAKETEEKVLDYLKTHHFLFSAESYKHEYPFCWRCGTALLYYARNSWFIAMSKLKSKLLSQNKKINWIPENLKNGRFGGWLKEVKDWAFSRERYWGTPLPIWECRECGNAHAIQSREELSLRMGKSRNNYILMRHGNAENNSLDIINNNPRDLEKFALTLKGLTQSEKSGRELNKEKIDLIVASDFRRTRETAEIIRKKIGLKEEINLDRRLREINTGIYDGGPGKDYWKFFNSTIERFTKTPPQGESLRDVCKRVSNLLTDLEDRYEGKTILLVTHEYGVWAIETVMRGWSEEESARAKSNNNDFILNAQWRKVPMFNLPRNEYGIADLHRPYVDDAIFPCDKCKEGRMKRIKEVADVWFDSGSMPFAQAHYPFSEQSRRRRVGTPTRASEPKTENRFFYPADYICEAIDQTRGWFYTLLAVSTLLGKEGPYKNVIVNGILLDKHNQKMSKSKGNIIDPWVMVEKYGADVVRWYFYTTNVPGESKSFDEADLGKTSRQFFTILYNSFVFYETYADKKLTTKNHKLTTKNILDEWILARLNQVIAGVTKNLDAYEIGEAARIIEYFVVEDVSRWYIRRSRRRLQKPESQKDFETASLMLQLVLKETAKLIAPFAPFFGEGLYKSLVSRKDASVHLEEWPTISKKLNAESKKLIEEMGAVRHFAALGLAKRSELGIKVRQPLASIKLTTKNLKLKTSKDLLKILADEVNVKSVVFDPKQKEEVVLDTVITPELRAEGMLREFVRTVQDLRQGGGLRPRDLIVLMIQGSSDLETVLKNNEKTLKKEVNAKSIEYKKSAKFNAEIQTKFEDQPLWLGLKKVK